MLPRLTRDWEGETVFVVAGGPSVSQRDVDRLRGERVVVINSSFVKAPWADALVFTDYRWWREYQNRVRQTFEGQIITLSPQQRDYSGLLVLQRQKSSGVSTDPTRLAWFHTSMTSALNMIALRGAKRACILGLDGEGDWHHEPHPAKWGLNKGKFAYHAKALEMLAEPLAAMGLVVLNLNLNSKHGMFQFATLDEVLKHEHQMEMFA